MQLVGLITAFSFTVFCSFALRLSTNAAFETQRKASDFTHKRAARCFTLVTHVGEFIGRNKDGLGVSQMNLVKISARNK